MSLNKCSLKKILVKEVMEILYANNQIKGKKYSKKEKYDAVIVMLKGLTNSDDLSFDQKVEILMGENKELGKLTNYFRHGFEEVMRIHEKHNSDERSNFKDIFPLKYAITSKKFQIEETDIKVDDQKEIAPLLNLIYDVYKFAAELDGILETCKNICDLDQLKIDEFDPDNIIGKSGSFFLLDKISPLLELNGIFSECSLSSSENSEDNIGNEIRDDIEGEIEDSNDSGEA